MKRNFFLVGFAVGLFVLFSLVGAAYPVAIKSSAAVTSSSFVPSSSSATCPSGAHPNCPMGVVDYGETPKGALYSYTAVSFLSSVTFTKLSIGASSIKGVSGEMSVQQNVIAENMFENGVAGYYWTQDVPFVTQQSGGKFAVSAVDNIWNFNSASAKMGTVHGNLFGDCASSGIGSPGGQWFCESKESYTTTLPFTVQMEMLVGEISSGTFKGSSAVEFCFTVLHGSTKVGSVCYDEVAFNGKASSFPLYIVDGAASAPNGLFLDAETVFCGPGGGSTVKITSIAASITEKYQATSGASFKTVPHAYSEGSDTAETVSNVHMGHSGTTGKASSGADNGAFLW